MFKLTNLLRWSRQDQFKEDSGILIQDSAIDLLEYLSNSFEEILEASAFNLVSEDSRKTVETQDIWKSLQSSVDEFLRQHATSK